MVEVQGNGVQNLCGEFVCRICGVNAKAIYLEATDSWAYLARVE